MPDKITFQELLEKLRDIDTPDEDLRPYFAADPDRTRPLAPTLRPNPDTVEFAPEDEFLIEGAMGMDWANGVCRWRRRKRFERRKSNHDPRPVLVSEGDSWFEFPILLRDVVDQLDADYSIWCVAAAGDTLDNMIHIDPEYLDALDANRDTFKAFLFSGGGNDIVGEDPDGSSVLEKVLQPFEAGRPAAWYLQTDAFNDRLTFIEKAYRTVLDTVQRNFPGRPVLVHGYDYAIPGGFASDPRHPIYASQDEWIGRFLRGELLGIVDVDLQREIVRLMIDRLNEIQQRLCGGNHRGGVFSKAFHVDVRQTLTQVTDWNDELHPTDQTFPLIAAKFSDVLRQAIAS